MHGAWPIPTTSSISREKSTDGTGAIDSFPTTRFHTAAQSAVSMIANRTPLGSWLLALR